MWFAWCQANNHDPGTQNNLTRKLQASELGPDVYDPNVKKDIGGKRVRVYLGFDFKLDDKKRQEYIYYANNRKAYPPLWTPT